MLKKWKYNLLSRREKKTVERWREREREKERWSELERKRVVGRDR